MAEQSWQPSGVQENRAVFALDVAAGHARDRASYPGRQALAARWQTRLESTRTGLSCSAVQDCGLQHVEADRADVEHPAVERLEVERRALSGTGLVA